MQDLDKLWVEYRENGCSKAREALVEHFVGLVRYVVGRMGVPDNGCVTRDDLVGHAIVGLIDAVERFDPSRGVRFETYAVVRIRGAVVDTLRRLDWAPRSLRRTESSIRDTFARLEAQLNRPASDDEVAEAMGISQAEYQDALSSISQTAVFSLEEYLRVDDQGEGSFASDGILDESPGPATLAMAEEQKRALASAVDQLPERERLVVSLYYYEDLTLKEIAEVLGVSEARVSQINTRAVLRLGGKLERVKALFCA
jgi:RNA polymerase sigma factor FliA